LAEGAKKGKRQYEKFKVTTEDGLCKYENEDATDYLNLLPSVILYRDHLQKKLTFESKLRER
jgi:hypothetical protein